MKVVVANLVNTTKDFLVGKTLHTNEILLDRRLADLSIQLDEYMFNEYAEVDVVYVCRDHEQNDLGNIAVYDQETVYFPHGPSGSFYCSPEIFSILGKMYKLDFEKLRFTIDGADSVQLLTEKILFLLTRLGYKLNVQE